MKHPAQARWCLVALFVASCTSPPLPVAETPGEPTAVPPAGQPAAPKAPAWAEGLPETLRQPIVDVIHGQRVPDPYRWLEDLNNPKARAWLMAQDKVARRYLATLPGRDALHKRLAELAYVERTTAPLRRGERFFYERQHADKEKMVYYWRQGEQGTPNVLIDPNTLSDDGSVSVHGVFVSYDGRRAAYKLSENNADESTLYVREIKSGKDSKIDTIVGAKYAYPSWNRRGNGFYYTRLPVDPSIEVSERPGHAAIYFHRLGQNPKKDELIHPKTGDPRTFIHPELSRDGRFLFVYIYHGWTRTDVYFKDLRRRDKKFRPFVVGRNHKYEATAWMGRIYVHTDDGAPNYRLFVVDPRKIERSAWQEIVPERSDAVLESFAVRGNHLSLHYLRRAATQLRIATLDGKPVREVELPGIGSSSGLVGNPEDDTAYFSFTSFTRPPTVYRTSVRKGGRTLHAETKVPVDPAPYAVEQVVYPSKDGTKVTMFIIRSKAMKRDGNTPFLLYGYGGFNVSLTPHFRGSWFVWLEQGGAIAIPNLRGGGEYGEKWHKAGMLTKKQNVFDDFIGAAEYLVKNGYTRPDKLAIRGGSNGGLLVGAAMVQRPDLFGAVACHVPLIDMVRYHLFGSGKTWISEYGSAEDKTQFEALFAYSPYHHVKSQTAYPPMLMLSADSDDRVDPMHARKFTAAIQHATSSDAPVILRVETKSGHGGGDMIKKRVAREADEWTFLLHQIGVRPQGR